MSASTSAEPIPKDLAPETVDDFWTTGYTIVPDVFSHAEMDAIRRAAYATRDHAGDLLSCPELGKIVTDPRVLRVAEQLLGSPPVYIGDGSCVFDGESGFHKDNPDRHDATGPDWNRPERYDILRFALYAQDHSEHSGGVGLRYGSHERAPRSAGRSVYAHSRLGDLVVWNLRTTHRGMVDLLRWPRVPLPRKLGKKLPSLLKLPRPEGERIGCFWSYGADGPHLDRMIEYLRHRSYAIERWRATKYDAETLERARRSGLIVRDFHEESFSLDLASATLKHQPLA